MYLMITLNDLFCRRGRAIAARVPPEPGAGAQHWCQLLPDHLPRAATAPREDGHQHQGGRSRKGEFLGITSLQLFMKVGHTNLKVSWTSLSCERLLGYTTLSYHRSH